ncbi:MAG: RluA family pseudouridine synthase [Bacilli bacterium]
MDKISLKILDKYDGLTIKEFFKSYYLGKGKIEELRNSKNVCLNKKQVSIEEKIKKDDILEIYFTEKIDFKPSSMELDVLYEDECILLVNKPSGIIIHPEYKDEEADTLVNRVANYFYHHKIFRNVRYVHRIDLETSGIVLFCKDFLSFALLNHLMEEHQIERKYLALCQNKFKNKEGVVDIPLSRDRHCNNKYRVNKNNTNSNNSKSAYTTYKVIDSKCKKCTLVELLLKTGRTHQIRVHMAYINHPLCGDELYGGNKDLIKRVALHSYSISFFHPFTSELIKVECPLPTDMKEVIEND